MPVVLTVCERAYSIVSLLVPVCVCVCVNVTCTCVLKDPVKYNR